LLQTDAKLGMKGHRADLSTTLVNLLSFFVPNLNSSWVISKTTLIVDYPPRRQLFPKYPRRYRRPIRHCILINPGPTRNISIQIVQSHNIRMPRKRVSGNSWTTIIRNSGIMPHAITGASGTNWKTEDSLIE